MLRGDETFTDRFAVKPPSPTDAPPHAPARERGDLFETYLGRDPRPLFQDVDNRPNHYSERQREIVQRIQFGQDTTAQQRGDVLMQFMRSTQGQKHETEVRRRVSRTIVEPDEAPPSFEQQDMFRGAIKLI